MNFNMSPDVSPRKFLRLKILDTVFSSGTGHLGGSLSSLDFIYSLYTSSFSNFSFVLSKGHASLALYSVLDTLDTSFHLEDRYGSLSKLGDLHGHVSKKASDTIALSCGSLGHGLPFSLGLSVSNFIKNNKSSVICLLGDGECQEGTTWESLLLLKKFSSTSLLIVIDNNQSQSSYDGFQISSIVDMFAELNLPVVQINAHDIESIESSIKCFFASNCPMLLVLNSTKGYGIPSIHNQEQWHAGKPSLDQYNIFREEIISFNEL